MAARDPNSPARVTYADLVEGFETIQKQIRSLEEQQEAHHREIESDRRKLAGGNGNGNGNGKAALSSGVVALLVSLVVILGFVVGIADRMYAKLDEVAVIKSELLRAEREKAQQEREIEELKDEIKRLKYRRDWEGRSTND